MDGDGRAARLSETDFARKGVPRVPDTNPWPRRAGCGDGGGTAVDGRVRPRCLGAGISQLRIRAHRRTGRRVLPDQRRADPYPGTDRRTGLRDRPGRDGRRPRRRARRPAPRRAGPGQLGRAGDAAHVRVRAGRPRDGAGPAAHRPAGAQRRAHRRLRRPDRPASTGLGGIRHPGPVPAPARRRQRRRGASCTPTRGPACTSPTRRRASPSWPPRSRSWPARVRPEWCAVVTPARAGGSVGRATVAGAGWTRSSSRFHGGFTVAAVVASRPGRRIGR